MTHIIHGVRHEYRQIGKSPIPSLDVVRGFETAESAENAESSWLNLCSLCGFRG